MNRMTTEEFIKKAKEIHGDKYDYSLVDYNNARTKVKIICPIHGVFEQEPRVHLINRGCKKCNHFSPGGKSLTTEYFIKKAKEIHGDKYDYSLVEYKNSITKVKIICQIHGIFEQTPANHLFRKSGCPKCIGKNSTIEEFIQKANKIYGDKYDYSLVDYKNKQIKVKIICPIHGIFETAPHNFLSNHGCPKCGLENKTKSIGEQKIKNFLKDKKIIFEEQKEFENLKDKKMLSYDFYIPSKKILIEYNGKQHYEFHKLFHKNYHDFLIQKHHDWLKRKFAKNNEYKLLTIPYWDCKIIEEILNKELTGEYNGNTPSCAYST